MTEAYIGLGGNLGRPATNIASACTLITRLPETRVVEVSSLYRSSPMVQPAVSGQRIPRRHHSGRQVYNATKRRLQPDYVNAVARIETKLTAVALLNRLQGIEKQLGRVRTGYRWGPRMIDLDLLLYGKEVINLPRLQVPHSGLGERAFVLFPIAEIAGDALPIPGRGRLGALLQRFSGDEVVRLPVAPPTVMETSSLTEQMGSQ